MKHYKQLLIVIACVVVVFTLAWAFMENKKAEAFDTLLLDSIRYENTKIIEANNERFEAYKDSIALENYYQQNTLAEIINRKINWQNEYRKTTLYVGTSLDSAFSEARKRILSKYRAGRFEPRGEERNTSTRIE